MAVLDLEAGGSCLAGLLGQQPLVPPLLLQQLHPSPQPGQTQLAQMCFHT